MRIYLAGPDVFHPEARRLGEQKRAICAELGLKGVFPLDRQAATAGLPPRAAGLAIAAKDFSLVRSCDAALVNLTPYLGPSMDAGTAVELGFFAGLNRPAMGYTNDARNFEDRAGLLLPHVDWLAERFTLCDNLMVEGALATLGGQVHRPERTLPFEALETFRDAAAGLARLLQGQSAD